MPGSFTNSQMSRVTMTEKEAFFSGLDRLYRSSDDSESEFDCLLRRSRLEDGKTSFAGSCHVQEISHSPHLFPTNIKPPSGDGATHNKSLVPPSALVSIIEIEEPELVLQDMGRSKKPADRKSTAKRKRAPPQKIIPQHPQIFKNLVFFFFPNNDTSPLRRIRIQKSQEYGAVWARERDHGITHFIIDKEIGFEEFMKHMKLGPIPSTVALVNDGYPAECIRFGRVLSVTLARFHVKGAPSPAKAAEPTKPPPIQPPEAESSLPLKPYRKEQAQTQESTHSTEGLEKPPMSVQLPQVEFQEEGPEEIVHDSFLDREHDALDDLIAEVKATEHLPLDPLEAAEDDNTSAEESGDETSDESQTMRGNHKRRKPSHDERTAPESWQQKFACMQKHDSTSNAKNPNARTIEVLQQMLEYYTRTADHWRTYAYRKAVSALRKQPKKIMNRAEAIQIPGIGTRLADKIEEIVLTDHLRRLDHTSNTAEDRLLQEFMGIYGAGLSHASKWIAQGYKSLEDLKARATLTRSQQIGLERYYDFSQRIPRSEVQKHGDFVRRVVQKESPDMEVIIGGSYRRGAANSGDIDLIITRPDITIEEIRALMLDNVVPQLFEQGFLQVGLATTSRNDGSKWHGASKLPDGKLWRRIDLLFVPGSELGAALIYFTGNDIFNRSIRLLASKKSMRLNQRGLYADVLRGPQRVKLNEGRLLESRSERRIFELLGVPWRPPEHRIP
ncbi:hypothetical protein BJY04DRAFT_203124 [Aspergillus karnatakaensis]|uniref:DNA-directed DNA polymerase IV n=1 Tax=Aspergillus karnatakaensis TaxID=1810916 RepID=UPI003CCD5CCC